MRQNKNTDLINRLIKKSFGWLYSGDWTTAGCVYSGFIDMRGRVLGRISRRRMNPLFYVPPIFGGASIDAGEFTSPDGSALTVKQSFLSNAKRYSEAYRLSTGKRVAITVVSDETFFSN